MTWSKFQSFCALLLTWVIYSEICVIRGSTVEKDLLITYKQKAQLDKFREVVIKKLPHDYMKQDIYLIRWLRAQNFDLAKAEQMLVENLEWRKFHKMDSILKEVWTDMEDAYPYTLDIYDKEGKPVMIMYYGQWDLRGASLAGKFTRLVRYAEKLAEEFQVDIRRLQTEGKNVTQGIFLFDMDDFNVIQQGCPQCLLFFYQFYSSFEKHYPGMTEKIMIVNASPLFHAILQTVLNNIVFDSRDAPKVYNQDHKQYSRALLELIDEDQLPMKYGGKKPQN